VFFHSDQLPREQLALLQDLGGTRATLVTKDGLEVEQLAARPLDAIDGRGRRVVVGSQQLQRRRLAAMSASVPSEFGSFSTRSD
jgi:hypothetical protein